MATNFDINTIVKASIEALTPALATAIASALTSLTAQTAPTNDNENQNENKPTTAKGKGFRKGGKHIDSEFTPIEGQLNVCEYSEKSIAIWGDTKDKADLIDYIKHVGTHDKHKANFVTPLSAIASRPVGWTINKAALDANGGLDKFLDSIQGLGFEVILRDSVKDVFEANKAAREQSKGTDKSTTPTPTTTTAQTTGKGKSDKPSIAPTDEQRKGKGKATADTPKATAPAKPTAKVLTLSFKGQCYDNSKDTDEGYKVTERDLIKRGDYYVAQGAKGARIYAKVGQYVGTDTDLFACIAIVKGEAPKDDCEETRTWTAQSKDILKAIKGGTLKASNALMYAYVDCGDQSAVDAIFAKLAA